MPGIMYVSQSVCDSETKDRRNRKTDNTIPERRCVPVVPESYFYKLLLKNSEKKKKKMPKKRDLFGWRKNF